MLNGQAITYRPMLFMCLSIAWHGFPLCARRSHQSLQAHAHRNAPYPMIHLILRLLYPTLGWLASLCSLCGMARYWLWLLPFACVMFHYGSFVGRGLESYKLTHCLRNRFDAGRNRSRFVRLHPSRSRHTLYPGGCVALCMCFLLLLDQNGVKATLSLALDTSVQDLVPAAAPCFRFPVPQSFASSRPSMNPCP